MELSNRLPSRRGVLRAFLVSISVSALLGIGALLIGEFSSFEAKVLLTSFSVSAGTLGVLCGAALLEARGFTFPSVPTMALSALATGLAVMGLWAEWFDLDGYWKLAAISAIFAATGAQCSLLGLADLASAHGGARVAAAGGAFLLAVLVSAMILAESDDEGAVRLLAALSIFTAAATLSVPILHRMNASEPAPCPSGPPVAMLCPACGARQEAPPGDVQCVSCGQRFRLELLPGGAVPAGRAAGSAQG